jgi:O-antigen biosynthesis protein
MSNSAQKTEGVPSIFRKKPLVDGYFDGFTDGEVRGWAISDTMKSVVVDVLFDGVKVKQGITNVARDDVDANRPCGFAIRIPDHLLDGHTRLISVQIVGADTLLAPGPLLIKMDEPLQPQSFERHDLFLLFDADYYKQQAGEMDDPLTHYQTVGWLAGHNPHPLFDTRYYCTINRVEEEPLRHFFAVGRHHVFETSPLFNAGTYARQRPDIFKEQMHPLIHYLLHGYNEIELVNDFFDERYYATQCPGVKGLGIIPMIHYLLIGWREGKDPHPSFQSDLFCRVARTADNPLNELARGLIEGANRLESGIRNSIIILNYNKPLLTLQCVYFVLQHTKMDDCEIIVVDNNSSSEGFELLTKYARLYKLIRLGANRGFGEANNIAAEAARGDTIIFLNNDAYVTDGWLQPLLNVLDSDLTVGAAGPKFLYPDGRIQEAGAMLAVDGTAVQRGKRLENRSTLFSTTEPVDYCSAATLAIRKSDFLRVLGFDLCWDPAYYEDSDLCLKLRVIGKKTLYVPASVVYHIEGSTSSDSKLNLKLHNIVDINRVKFIDRWSAYIDGSSPPTMTFADSEFRPLALVKEQTVYIYTPYPLTPGGGERYLLTIADALRAWRVVLLVPDLYSRIRLLTIGRELDLELAHVEIRRFEDVSAMDSPSVFIAMGNEALPPVKPVGVINIYHCQFPFPMTHDQVTRNWSNLDGYHRVIVNSAFTSRHYEAAVRQIGLPRIPCDVLYPPAPQHIQRKKSRAPTTILNVGRFSSEGHCKRQDVMIEAFRTLVKVLDADVELHLAGSIGAGADARVYINKLQRQARDLPVIFHFNVSSEHLGNLYQTASIYWHLTGIGDDTRLLPEKLEHFGISICEAMSAGAVPVVFGSGGPCEIINHEVDGFLIQDKVELVETTQALVEMPDETFSDLGDRASRRAASFSSERFIARLHTILEGV